MAKRKQSGSKVGDADDDSDNSSSDVSLIDVSFDFFDPNPEIDYQALKRLITQLFHHDAELLNVHELTELVLSQPTVGTTVKTDGIESDPYAVLTVLNMNVWKDHPSVKAITEYVLQKTKTQNDVGFYETLQTLFSQAEKHVGLVICERLVNMPVQVIPPMYKMLKDEMGWAVADGEPYAFSHLLFISRTYHLMPEDENAVSTSALMKPSSSKRARKANKQGLLRPIDGIYSFHPEDDCIKQFAIHTLDYSYTKMPSEPRDKESFGLDVRGRAMLVACEKFEELVKKMNGIYSNPQA